MDYSSNKKKKNKFDKIFEVEIENKINWKKKHKNSIITNYSSSPFFQEHRTWLENFYDNEWDLLLPMLEYSTKYILEYLNISAKLIKSSDLKVTGKKSEYIKNLCLEVGAKTYLSGVYGKDYLNIEGFNNSKIDVKFQNYIHPEYKQIHGNFEPNMSIIDLLFNCGSDSLSILRNSNK